MPPWRSILGHPARSSIGHWTKTFNGRTQQRTITGYSTTQAANRSAFLKAVVARTARSVRKARESPSKVLEDIINIAGLKDALPVKTQGKLDLAYASVAEVESLSRHYLRQRAIGLLKWRSLQSILAYYVLQTKVLDSATAAESQGTKVIFSSDQAQVLASKGYKDEAVETWASIFCEPSIDLAAVRLLASSGLIAGNTGGPTHALPVFLPLHLLRRNDVTPAALRSLLIYAAHETQKRSASFEISNTHCSSTPNVIDASSMLLLIMRMLRHARKCWPEAMPTIAKLFISCMESLTQKRRPLANIRKDPIFSVTIQFNRMLRLLSLPCNITPFHSVAYQQRAQFDLVQKMATHIPPLPLTADGYEAITTVQLANKKTDRERDWDDLKAKSWPPWKSEKTGLDAEKGVEYGTSRALAVVQRARAAGYGSPTWSAEAWAWDRAAGVLAGWDSDRSPTIQTRTFLPYRFRRNRRGDKLLLSREVPTKAYERATAAVWAARIRATRTIQEAWACFLVMGHGNFQATGEVYVAMLEKLAYAPSASAEANDDTFDKDVRPLNAGDSRETTPNPESPKEATFVKIQPPSFDALATEMFQQGIIAGGQRLVFLLKHAPTFSAGLKYLEWTSQSLSEYACLLSPDTAHDSQLRQVSPFVLTAFIQFLCRFPSGDPRLSVQRSQGQDRKVFIHGRLPLYHALRVLRGSMTAHRPKFLVILRMLASNQFLEAFKSRGEDVVLRYLRRWNIMKQLYQDMKALALGPDVETFLLMCKGLESAVLVARSRIHMDTTPKVATMDDHQQVETDETPTWEPMPEGMAKVLLESSSEYIQHIFHDAMGTGKLLTANSHNDEGHIPGQIPRLLASPNGPALHVFVRVLGLLEDWQGLLNLVRWMIKYNEEIAAATDMPRHGPRALRRTIVAIRVFLEGRWQSDRAKLGTDLQHSNMAQASSSAPPRILAIAKRQICSIEAWGGWPTEEEIDAYVWRGRFPKYRNS